MALGLVQLLLAPALPIPWLPADSLLISGWQSWALWAVLICFVLLSSVPWDRCELGCVRGVLAFLQGCIIGRLVVFNVSTMFARFCFSVLLGVANALDRFSTIRRIQESVAVTDVALECGASGTYKYKGIKYPIVVKEVRGDQVKIEYSTNPFMWSNNDTVSTADVNLKLEQQPLAKVDMLVSTLATPGFAYRPWGYALGISVCQWILTGFSTSDSFVAGMMTQQAIVILSVPITAGILWLIAVSSGQEWVKCVALVYLVACFALGIIAYGIPLVIATTSFAIVELVGHQVVEFVVIPVDILVFLQLVSPSAEDLATTSLFMWYVKAENFIARKTNRKPIIVGDLAVNRALLLGS